LREGGLTYVLDGALTLPSRKREGLGVGSHTLRCVTPRIFLHPQTLPHCVRHSFALLLEPSIPSPSPHAGACEVCTPACI